MQLKANSGRSWLVVWTGRVYPLRSAEGKSFLQSHLLSVTTYNSNGHIFFSGESFFPAIEREKKRWMIRVETNCFLHESLWPHSNPIVPFYRRNNKRADCSFLLSSVRKGREGEKRIFVSTVALLYCIVWLTARELSTSWVCKLEER